MVRSVWSVVETMFQRKITMYMHEKTGMGCSIYRRDWKDVMDRQCKILNRDDGTIAL